MLAVWGTDQQDPASWSLQARRAESLAYMMVSIMGVVEAEVTWKRQMAGFRDKVALREGAG